MPNTYFEFKQFTVQQAQCAMKVCTDACLFGAWMAEELWSRREHLPSPDCLDIGSGTGLLSLMLAQKNKEAMIDAVEIEPSAARQTEENFNASPWCGRLQVHNNSIQAFNPLINENKIIQNKQYDFIFSNPPFFENDLKSPNTKRNMAMHNNSLELSELLAAVHQLLKPEGQFAVLLPYTRTSYFIDLCKGFQLYPAKKVSVQQSPKHGNFRSMIWFTQIPQPVNESNISIRDGKNEYTAYFKGLLNDYYLHL